MTCVYKEHEKNGTGVMTTAKNDVFTRLYMKINCYLVGGMNLRWWGINLVRGSLLEWGFLMGWDERTFGPLPIPIPNRENSDNSMEL